MSNSKLVNYTKISPNKNAPRNHKIDKITIHHMAGNMTIENCCAMFARPSRQGSCNYCVGTDGRIGLCVDEKDRSWCSSSGANDHRAITIEVANDGGAPNWHVSDKALNATIELCVDICKRNGIKKLNFTGDKNGNLTMHKYFTSTACPGPYLGSKFPYIAAEVNKRLNPPKPSKPNKPTVINGFKPGDIIKIKEGAVYASNGKRIQDWVLNSTLYFRSQNANGTIVFSTLKTGAITGSVDPKYVVGGKQSAKPAQPQTYKVKVTAAGLNIRSGPSVTYKINGTITDKGVYTIVDTKDGWGKLKSGAGWISLKYTEKI